jgi:uncharacterized ParB-like nuclease family protein
LPRVRRVLALVIVAAAAAALLAPAVASASDQSVYDAYVSHDSDFAKLGKQFKRDVKRWTDSGYKRRRPVLKDITKIRKLIATVTGAIKAEAPSSANGKHAKAAALASVRYLDGSLAAGAKAIRALNSGHRKRAKRYADRAKSLSARSVKAEKRAREWFKAAGVQIKP